MTDSSGPCRSSSRTRDELLVGIARGAMVPDPANYAWMSTRATTTHHQVAVFELDPGERAALSLALNTADAIVVLDDAAARAAATSLGIATTGTLGVLVLAKERGLVSSVTAVVAELESRGFRISAALLAHILSVAGEAG